MSPVPEDSETPIPDGLAFTCLPAKVRKILITYKYRYKDFISNCLCPHLSDMFYFQKALARARQTCFRYNKPLPAPVKPFSFILPNIRK
jgi:hypothetical protein